MARLRLLGPECAPLLPILQAGQLQLRGVGRPGLQCGHRLPLAAHGVAEADRRVDAEAFRALQDLPVAPRDLRLPPARHVIGVQAPGLLELWADSASCTTHVKGKSTSASVRWVRSGPAIFTPRSRKPGAYQGRRTQVPLRLPPQIPQSSCQDPLRSASWRTVSCRPWPLAASRFTY